MKTKDLILIALVCANIVLSALAAGLYLGRAESAAWAASQCRAGDYVMVTGSISTSREGVLLIDTVAKRANFYAPKAGTTATGATWELLDSHNLATDFSGGP